MYKGTEELELPDLVDVGEITDIKCHQYCKNCDRNFYEKEVVFFEKMYSLH